MTRRALVQSAAWSVPVIVAAASAPLAAASVDACAEQVVEITGVRISWNDGANGNKSSGTHLGLPVYANGVTMFADFTVRNDGAAVVSGFRVIFNLSKGLWAANSLSAVALRPDNTPTPPTEVLPHHVNPATPHLDSIPFDFDGLILQPGESIRFRLHWTTAPSTGGGYIRCGLYGIVNPRTILCNDVHVPRSRSDEPNPTNNDAHPANDFFVRSP